VGEARAEEQVSLAERIEGLPQLPGVYLMQSSRGRVLYVGKAQNLRARVRSYFGGGDGRIQVPKLVRRIADVSVLITPSVKEALLLENELIKQHRPPFNVRLRDDKQYLGLRLDLRPSWPRLTQVRRFERDGALYFGPYTSSGALHQSLAQLRRVFPLRSCSDAVFKDYARRGRPCIEHEMKRCPGPCVGLVTPEAYRELLAGTELFLRGRSEELVETLRARMEAAAGTERFEEAARLRDRITAVEQTVLRQQIVTDRRIERDVFGLARRGEVGWRLLTARGGASWGMSHTATPGPDRRWERSARSSASTTRPDLAGRSAPFEPADAAALATCSASAPDAASLRVPPRALRARSRWPPTPALRSASGSSARSVSRRRGVAGEAWPRARRAHRGATSRRWADARGGESVSSRAAPTRYRLPHPRGRGQ
jgi:excinuclease UvrABC nuclease subunit